MVNNEHILIVGCGGHAKSCIDVIEEKYKICGFIGGESDLGKKIFSYDVLGTDESLCELSKLYRNAFIAVGQIHDSSKRMLLYKTIQDYGFCLPTLLSKYSLISKYSSIGFGTIIMPGVIIKAGVEIGDNCIVNSGSIIEHDVQISSHTHISTGAILNGNVFVGQGSFVGSGSVVREGVKIGENSFIGMGMSIIKNVESEMKVNRSA